METPEELPEGLYSYLLSVHGSGTERFIYTFPDELLSLSNAYKAGLAQGKKEGVLKAIEYIENTIKAGVQMGDEELVSRIKPIVVMLKLSPEAADELESKR